MLTFLRCTFLLLTAFGLSAALPEFPSGAIAADTRWAAPLPAECRSLPSQSFEIVRSFPHDPEAFTQGLLFHQGYLYESTGLHGRSSLRKVEIETGRVVQSVPLPPALFGEGLALWRDRLIQLTWQSGVGLVYDMESFRLLREFRYPGDGWGLAEDGELLIMTDGGASLIFMDPETFEERRRVEVRCGATPVRQLNELEMVRGELLANIFGTDLIVRVSPRSGTVLGWIDLRGLRTALGPVRGPDVLNGIAYDPSQDRLFVTGKLWPKLFELRLKPTP